MTVLFIHSVKFYKMGNCHYTNNLSSKIWREQYLKYFDNLIVMGRCTQNITIEADKLVLSDCEKVTFNNLTFNNLYLANLLHRKKINEIMFNNIRNSDLIIIRLPYPLSSKIIKYCKKNNKPYLVEVVGCAWDALWNHSLKGKLIALTSFISMKKTVKNAPYVKYVSNKFLQKRYPCSGKTIGCSDVALQSLENDILGNRLNKIANMNKPIILGTISAVDVRYKGQQYVIEAIAKLKDEGYDFEYHLVGGGDQSNLKNISVKLGVQNNIVFKGSLSHDKIFQWLDTIDIYVQPSLTEGLPRAIIEAMSRACPVIGSNAGGIPELIPEKYVFKKKNTRDLIRVLKLVEKDNLEDLAKVNFKRAKDFSPELLNDKRNAFYKEFAESVRKIND